MYRIVVVDDEPEIADAISKLCKTELMTETDVITFYAGRKAWEFLQEENIDLLISDICMPGTGGLDLVKRVKEHHKSCKVILLTGYREFDYAYEAIQNEVVSYIMKSEPKDKILNCIQGILDGMDKEQEQQELFQRAQKQLDELSPLIQKEYLNRILIGEVDFNITAENFRRFHLPFSIDKPLHLVVGMLDSFDGGADFTKKYQYSYALKDIFDENISKITEYISFINADYLLVCIFQMKNDDLSWNKERVAKILEQIQKKSQSEIHITMSFSVSSEGVTVQELSEMYADLLKLLYLNIGIADNMILLENKEEKETDILGYRNFSSQYQALSQDLVYQNKEHYFQVFNELSEVLMSCQSKNNPKAQEIYCNLVGVLLTFLNNHNIREKLALKVETYRLMRIDEYIDWIKATQYLYKISQSIFEVMMEKQMYLRGSIKQVEEYVEKHLEDFSLNDMAETLHFNATYISRLYKNATGIKLLDYVQERRLELAKERLDNGNEKINDIGNKVGYDNPQSFHRFFKRLTGLTPQEYRHKNRKS